MNVAELTDRVRRLTGIRMPDILSDDQILDLLNEAYNELMGLTDWPFLHVHDTVTTTGSQFDTHNVLRNVQSVISADSTRLHETTLNDLERYSEQPSDDPFAYARVSDRRYRIWPDVADGTSFTLRGIKLPDQLLSPYDSPVFDAEFHLILAYTASSRALSEEADDSGRVQMYMQEAAGILDRMRMRYLNTKDTVSFQMGGKRGLRSRWRVW
jgi:hypothetical protein